MWNLCLGWSSMAVGAADYKSVQPVSVCVQIRPTADVTNSYLTCSICRNIRKIQRMNMDLVGWNPPDIAFAVSVICLQTFLGYKKRITENVGMDLSAEIRCALNNVKHLSATGGGWREWLDKNRLASSRLCGWDGVCVRKRELVCVRVFSYTCVCVCYRLAA